MKELAAAQQVCTQLDVHHHIVDLRSVTDLLHTSALTNPNIDVPEGHYTEENMKATVVPNRNMIMASIAVAYAISERAKRITLGVHSGDHAVYPDCRPSFILSLEATVVLGNEGFISPAFIISTPWLFHSKAQIIELTRDISVKVPWELTWSCYNGGEIHCGRCATCVERLEAFHIAGRIDPVDYEDRAYWRGVCGVGS